MIANYRSIAAIGLAACVGLAAVSPARADYAHDQAQQAASQAQANYDTAKKQADQLMAVAGSASANANQLTAQVQAQQQQAQDIRQRMSRGKAGLDEIQSRIDSATKILSARHQEMAAEDVQYSPLKVADDKARLDAIGQFENSPEYRSALQAVTDMAANLQSAQGKSVSLGHNPAGDPNVLIAQNRLAAAKSDVDALRGKFMQEQLPQIPQVATADQALAFEQGRYDSIAARATIAEKELADAKAQLDRQNAGLAGDQKTLDQLASDTGNAQSELASAQAATTQAADEAGRAIAYMNSERQARDDAAAALQQLDAQPAYVYPPSTYAYPPPPVVYGQPGNFYGPGYYGGIVVVPGYRGGYGYGGYRGGYGGGPVHQGTYSHGHGGHR